MVEHQDRPYSELWAWSDNDVSVQVRVCLSGGDLEDGGDQVCVGGSVWELCTLCSIFALSPKLL